MLMVLNRELIGRSGARSPRLRTYFAFGTLLVGCTAFAGWAMDIPALTSVYPAFVPMVVNTALSFMTLGGGMLLLPAGIEFGRLTWRKSLAIIFASLAMMIGILTLAEYATGIPFGIDELFF